MRKQILLCFLLCLLVVTVSPAKIVFEQETDGDESIYVIDDDGTEATRLTDDLLNPGIPKWSPDGKQIIFARGRNVQRRHISLMNVDGTNIRDITPPSNLKRDNHPSFSPDGKSIVFRRYEPAAEKDKQDSVWVMTLESGNLKKISDLGINSPDFSPDGKHIVFTTIPTLGFAGGNVWIMEDDGADPHPLLPDPPDNPLIISRNEPRWSLDGKQILYTEDHYTLDVIDNAIHYIPQGYYFFICDRNGNNIKKLNIPKTLRSNGHDWMDRRGKSIVFCAREAVLKEPPLRENFEQVKIYKYHIPSDKLTLLYTPQGNAFNLDWISDHVLSVSPVGKKKMTWGTLKK